MKRKVNLVGQNTLTVSLPSKWTKNHGIKKGDEVEILEEKNKVIISPSALREEKKHIEIKLPKMHFESIEWLIRVLYIQGYDSIKLSFDFDTVYHERLKKNMSVLDLVAYELRRLMGLEIVHSGKNFCLLKCLSKEAIDEFDISLKRSFIILSETLKEISKALETGLKGLAQYGQDVHDQITRLIAYDLRTLNKIGYKDDKTTLLLYHLLWKIDDIVDLIKYWSREIDKKTQIKNYEISKILRQLSILFNEAYLVYYKFSLEKVSEWFTEREKLRKELIKLNIKSSKQERRHIAYIEQILEELFKIVVIRMSLNY
ncbi:MAG: AbrB/MazE/SpoVT family DNA-binding domain-containing protein [Nanoarchaeota archaeon]